MAKISYIKIAGKNYPMSFSLGAARKIMKDFGNVEKAKKKLEEEDNEKKIKTVIDMLEVLIAQGCAYKNYFEKDLPAPEDAPVINGRWEPMPAEVLEIAVGITDIKEATQKIKECMKEGAEKEIEAKVSGKNAEATHGE